MESEFHNNGIRARFNLYCGSSPLYFPWPDVQMIKIIDVFHILGYIPVQ